MFMGIVADFDISSYSTKLQNKYVLVYIWKCIIGTWFNSRSYLELGNEEWYRQMTDYLVSVEILR
jgi:hypothetical protein